MLQRAMDAGPGTLSRSDDANIDARAQALKPESVWRARAEAPGRAHHTAVSPRTVEPPAARQSAFAGAADA